MDGLDTQVIGLKRSENYQEKQKTVEFHKWYKMSTWVIRDSQKNLGTHVAQAGLKLYVTRDNHE